MKDGLIIHKLVRSRRKTVALEVNDRAEVVVRAPRWVSQKFIFDFVHKHAVWIETQKRIAEQRSVRARTFAEGERFWYVGEQFPLSITTSHKKLSLSDEGFALPQGTKNPQKAFEDWYKNQAKSFIIPRVRELARKHGLEFENIRITSAKTRWGSCSAKKNLSFSWRLIFFPQEVMDYVICHELAHLKHMNHSQKFWNLVGEMCPKFQAYKQVLNDKKYLW